MIHNHSIESKLGMQLHWETLKLLVKTHTFHLHFPLIKEMCLNASFALAYYQLISFVTCFNLSHKPKDKVATNVGQLSHIKLVFNPIFIVRTKIPICVIIEMRTNLMVFTHMKARSKKSTLFFKKIQITKHKLIL